MCGTLPACPGGQRPEIRSACEPKTIRNSGVESRPANVIPMDMPRHWIVLQVLIVIFVLAGAVIAITKLA
jgi:hypothetical protein